MAVLPSFFRTETWHPLVVHFPIVLLLAATVFKIIFLCHKRDLWDFGCSVLLYSGTLGAWLAVYTGSMADVVVVRKLCDPIVLETHEHFAFLLSYLFSTASVLDILWRHVPILKIKLIQIAVVAAMLAGSGFLSYAGHMGASLVYQQAAGVYIPSENCEEFIDNR